MKEVLFIVMKHNVEKEFTYNGEIDQNKVEAFLKTWEFWTVIKSNTDLFVKFYSN